ncbi:MAG: peptidoglycan-associated lipoprotein Pal [Pseudomonadota bacterium]
MRSNIQFLAVLAVSVALVACGGNRTLPPSDSGSIYGEDEVADNNADSSSAAGSGIRSTGLDDDLAGSTTADTLIIYFDYDKSEVRPEYVDLLATHARRLAADGRQQLRLEGHGDERGSREYNIGLGERRAQAVRRLLLIQGASSAQISTVSYGEERPAAFGSTESDYEKNRRVELSYRR